MRTKIIFLNLIGLLLSVNQIFAEPKTPLEVPVEVMEVRELGLSDGDESKSVVEVRWSADAVLKEKIVSFNLVLFVTYADGTTVAARRSADKDARLLKVEVPSVRTLFGRPPAFIKKLDARVTAVISKN